MDLDEYEAKLRHRSAFGLSLGLVLYVLILGVFTLLGSALVWVFWRSVFG